MTTTNPFEAALKTARPGDWSTMTELYASPKDAKVQADLKRWLDKYAATAEDAETLLDARDYAAEAGIRSLDEIARRAGFKAKR